MNRVNSSLVKVTLLFLLSLQFHSKAFSNAFPDPNANLACPTSVTPLFTTEEVCSGSNITVPTDAEILANVDIPDNAFVDWEQDIGAPVFNLSQNCEIIEIEFNYTIRCTESLSFSLEGGTHTVTVYPELQAPIIDLDFGCVYDVMPSCAFDMIEPDTVNPNVAEQEFTVTNPLGCSEVFTVNVPSCLTPITTSDISIIQNCDEYYVTFTINGGTGNYFVSGVPLGAGVNVFASDPIPCGTPHQFVISDNINSSMIIVSGNGPSCYIPVFTSEPIISVVGNQYRVSFIIVGGSGNYTVNGFPIGSSTYLSQFITCGEPYTFEVADECNSVTVAGFPVCYDPITVTEPVIIENCNEYQVQFSIMGGSGTYVVNGSLLTPGLFTYTSPPISCGTDYSIPVTDNFATDMITVEGTGSDCLTPIDFTPPMIEVIGNNYQVSFTLSGGTGNYTVNGLPVDGSDFVSPPVLCNTAYSFQVTDGCQTIFINGQVIECYEPIEVQTQIDFECNEYQVILLITGGTGNYVVNGAPLAPGQIEYVSDPLECATSYLIQVTDDIGSSTIELEDFGPFCFEELSATPEEFEMFGNQYRVSFTINNGTEDYVVNGQPLDGNMYVSELLDCGQPYLFNITDSCNTLVINGMLPECLDPINALGIKLSSSCNQYTVEFMLEGGSGNYLVDSIPIDGNLFVSAPLACNTPYSFEITDDVNSMTLTVEGDGPACNEPLSTSVADISTSNGQYTVGFSIFGGEGDYFIEGLSISDNTFMSSPINCGEPYSFTITDNCVSLIINGDSPCLPLLSTSDIIFDQNCDQYTAQFSINGGSGSYNVNGNLINGDTFTSELLDCETPYSFEITDNGTTDILTVSGTTPACPDPLDASHIIIEIDGDQFTVQITPSGGTGIYTINGMAMDSSSFLSESISCGEFYSFEVADSCELITIEGGGTTCDPIVGSEVTFLQDCETYQATFTISGGTGHYSVNDLAIGDSVFTSSPFQCGTPYFFEVIDVQTSQIINISGDGPNCFETLDTLGLDFEVVDSSYRVEFGITGGSGSYLVDGTAIDGNTFLSGLIECGTPFSFEISDSCNVILIEGDGLPCFDAMSVSEAQIEQQCDQFTAEFTISGGSGSFSINGTNSDSSFVSEPLPCDSTITFEVRDNQTNELILLIVDGPPCFDSLIVAEVDATILGNQYATLVTLNGGSGEYAINGTPLDGNLFISDTVSCGMPYLFEISDGCDTIIVEGDAPCDLCPDDVSDFTALIDQCHGELPGVPSQEDILNSLNIVDNAIIEWSTSPDNPLIHPGGSCDPVMQTFDLSVRCAIDSSVNVIGGTVSIMVYPEPQAPTMVRTDSTEISCICEVIPFCDDETVAPTMLEIPMGTVGATFDVFVQNGGCLEGITYTIPVPDCILTNLNDPLKNHFNLKIHHNPFGVGEKLGIQFTMPEQQQVAFDVYDLNGRKVRALAQQNFGTGDHYLEWDGRMENGQYAPAGMYMIALQTPNGRFVEKVMKYN